MAMMRKISKKRLPSLAKVHQHGSLLGAVSGAGGLLHHLDD